MLCSSHELEFSHFFGVRTCHFLRENLRKVRMNTNTDVRIAMVCSCSQIWNHAKRSCSVM